MSKDEIANELYDRFTIATYTIYCDGCEKEIDVQASDREDAVDIFIDDLGGSIEGNSMPYKVSCDSCRLKEKEA